VMRGHAASAVASHAKRESIFAALDAEPTVFAPAAASSVGAKIRSELESQKEFQHQSMPVAQVANGASVYVAPCDVAISKPRLSRLNLAVAAVASVASVGAISWLGMQQLRQSQQPAAIAATAQTVSNGDPASQLVGLASVGNNSTAQSNDAQLTHLGEYLAAHRQIANNSAIVPASRVVRPCTGANC
jgi:hypothetical protein